jgi:hypothetical protein
VALRPAHLAGVLAEPGKVAASAAGLNVSLSGWHTVLQS